jgi:hypothetical protein
MRRAFDIDVLACSRWIATVEDPEASRAILAAFATSRERADRAPPLAVSLDSSLAATMRLSAVRTPRTPRPVHPRLEPSCFLVNQLPSPLGIFLTRRLSALYLGAARASR